MSPRKAMHAQDAERPEVYGIELSPLTQCAHYHTALDIIAIKHFCCSKFYACISCHNTLGSHAPTVWPATQRHEKAVLCGQCKYVLSIEEYMASGSQCTKCQSGFNSGCKGHWNLYFELEEAERPKK